MLWSIFWYIVLLCFSSTLGNREGKFNLFRIVRFQNSLCTTEMPQTGTCYTPNECSDLGGIASQSCASGFGVCCIFKIQCGQSSSQNCTYFESPGLEQSGPCRSQICRLDNICQLRLDFERFTISGPSTSTFQSLRILNGVETSSLSAPVANTASQCLTDSFVITNPGGPSPPVLCGTNSGEHMYVDASPTCNNLVFQFGDTRNGAPVSNRDWFIKVNQIRCDDPNLPPQGCTQYFTGSGGTVRTFNYNEGNGQHLANQNQRICVRRESGNCRICWFTNNFETDFAVSGTKNANAFVKTSQGCCGYGTNGLAMNGFDCLVIPGAVKSISNFGVGSQICGRMGLATKTNGPMKSICSVLEPFSIRFLSDNFEFADDANPNVEAAIIDKGFQLQYIQDNLNC